MPAGTGSQRRNRGLLICYRGARSAAGVKDECGRVLVSDTGWEVSRVEDWVD